MALAVDSANTIGIPSTIGSPGFPDVGICGHYIGGNPVSRGSHSNCRRQVRGWHNYHKNGNGWAGLGYNWLICWHGVVMTGRGRRRIGAHAGPGANSSYQGICLMVGGNQSPTSAQWDALIELRARLRSQGVGSRVRGHRDFMSTSCPGSKVYPRLQNDLGSSSGSNPGTSPGSGSSSSGGRDPVIGLKKGDTGAEVKALQVLIKHAGVGLPQYGVDGDYGDETAEGLRKARKKAGSRAKPGYGDKVTGWAYAQLFAAVARRQ